MTSVSSSSPCVVCKTPSTTRCSQCKLSHYCSAKCQRKDWPTHKIACTPASKVTPPTSKNNTEKNSSTSNTKSAPVLPDPDKTLNVEPVSSSGPPLIRKPPLASSTRLVFEYAPSQDGVDENLVIFLHGLGDKIKPNFVNLAKSLNLPQTATCCIQAPTPVPYLEEEGWQWYPSFNNLSGELLGPDSPERMLQVKQFVRPELVKFLRHCRGHCGFDYRKIIFFGFSQGAEMALDVAAFGGMNLRGVVSIAGYMMEETQKNEPAIKSINTKVIIIQGDKDDSRTISSAKDSFKYIQRIFGKSNVEQRIVEGMGHGMPHSEAGWKPLMEFFAMNLDSRSVALEQMSDVYEIKN
ncbi:hypothetical protein BGZ76_011400 [Entomortierella beljakovae]|nr:hypothetical protein BGZ76_011400 [Entomortierella beljakovae]